MEESVDDLAEKKQNSMTIYQYDAQLALAFQVDCEELFNKFSQIKSFNFSDFSNLWKETCFISIFRDQEYMLMLQVFIENCFVVVKKYLFSSDPYYQLGAVFTLYALYYKQPIKQWVKIRLTHDETDKLNEIINFHKQNKRLEVAFIVSKLRLDGAFHYCALVQPMGLDAKFTKRVDFTGGEANKKTPIDRNPLKKFKNLLENNPLLKSLEDTDKEYQLLANKYREKCKELHIFPSNITDQIKESYRKTMEDLSKDSSEDPNPLISDVKARAMASKNATYRGESSRVTAMDLDISFSE